MAITLVQQNTSAPGGTATVALAFNSANTAGNLIAVIAGMQEFGAGVTVSDTLANSWVTFGTVVNYGGIDLFICYVLSAKAGANTVSLTNNNGGTGFPIYICEFNAGAGMGFTAADGNGVATGNAASITSSSWTTTNPNDLILMCGDGFAACTPASPYTAFTADSTNSCAGYQVVSSTGSYNATINVSPANNAVVSGIALAATSVGPPPPPAPVPGKVRAAKGFPWDLFESQLPGDPRARP